jgi:BMFP domain-containing protein YqiC
MQSNNKVLDDLAKVANSAVSTLVGMKGEAETLLRQQLERLLLEMDVAQRDEFEAVKAMAQKARIEQEKLENRVQELEAQLAKYQTRKTRK